MSTPVFSCVEHLGIAVADPVASARWYEKVLDFSVIFNDGKEPPTLLIEHPSGMRVEVMPKTDRPQPERHVRDPGWSHIALKVADLDKAAAELKARGLVFDTEPAAALGGGRVWNFNDPDGNMLQIVERPAG